MKVPTKVPIAGKEVTIQYVDALFDDDQTTPIFAETVEGDHLIKVSTSRPVREEQVWATLIHELVHIALEVSGVAQVLGAEKEEAVAHALDNLLAPVLQFRPRLAGASFKEITFDFEEDE